MSDHGTVLQRRLTVVLPGQIVEVLGVRTEDVDPGFHIDIGLVLAVVQGSHKIGKLLIVKIVIVVIQIDMVRLKSIPELTVLLLVFR